METSICVPVMSVVVKTSLKYWIEMVSSFTRSDWDIMFVHLTCFFSLSLIQNGTHSMKETAKSRNLMVVWLWVVKFLPFLLLLFLLLNRLPTIIIFQSLTTNECNQLCSIFVSIHSSKYANESILLLKVFYEKCDSVLNKYKF